MKYTKIPESTFNDLQLNAGVLLTSFDPAKPTVDAAAILGATSGGVNITAVPSFTDFGDDIDNCPKNMKELKKLESWEIKASGTFVSANGALVKRLAAAADHDESSNKVSLRNDLSGEDFSDLWWVGDYSDKNGDKNGGFIACHMSNALSTGGFSLQSGDKAKGQFAFEFMAHYSIAAQDVVPFEAYVVDGKDEAVAA